jgi:hypothetical protein
MSKALKIAIMDLDVQECILLDIFLSLKPLGRSMIKNIFGSFLPCSGPYPIVSGERVRVKTKAKFREKHNLEKCCGSNNFCVGVWTMEWHRYLLCDCE